MLGVKLGITDKQYNIVTDGLILEYEPAFNSSYPGSGLTINNIASSSYVNGTLKSGAEIVGTGESKSILCLSASSQYIIPGTGTDLNSYINDVDNSFTIGIWANWSGSSGGKTLTLAGNYPLSGTPSGWWMYKGATEIAVAALIDVLPNIYVAGTDIPITLDKWYNYTFVYNNTESINLYLDGVNQTNNQQSGNWDDWPSDGSFYIGRVDGAAGAEMEGNIGPILIYSRALSAGEVQQNYNAGKDRYYTP